jgi:acyl-CoA thioesterase-1
MVSFSGMVRRREGLQRLLGLPALAQCSGLLLGAAAVGLNAATRRGRLLVVGDSLSAEYGIARGSGWVALLQQRLRDQGFAVEVFNASVSGDTTAGGRARLPALLQQHRPTHLIIELGGNDALRGMPLAHTRANLRQMVADAKAAGAKVLLVGMQVPPNYGASYAREFAGLFEELGHAERVGVVPFLLSGFATRPDAERWFQSDRIHPLAKAHPLMLDALWPELRKLL